MVFQNDILAGSSGASGASSVYQIDQSIRFNDDDSAYMSRTPASASNRKTFSFSCWLKLGSGTIDSGAEKAFFSARDGSTDYYSILSFNGDQSGASQLEFVNRNGGSYAGYIYTTQLFRDPSAWYHIVLNVDTTDAISTERIRLYVNGSRVTDVTYSAPTLNLDMNMNNNIATAIGARPTNNFHFDGYMAEIVFIDGTALDPSSFGEYNSSGIWIPKDVSGLTFGTNGFHIDGRDSADLGDDESGNGNDFTTSGLASHDQVSDSPTNNFSTMNPLNPRQDGTLSQGNLKNVLSGDDQFYTTQELGFKSYCEVRIDAQSNFGGTIGLGTFGGDDDDNTLVFQTNYSSGFVYLNAGSASTNIGGTVSTGDIVMMAYDPTARKWWVGVNGTWRNSGDPAAGTGQIYQHTTTDFGDGIGAIVWGGWKGSANGLTVTWNFGQDGTFGGQETAGGNSDGNGVGNFKYTVPSGFLANCTKNLGS